MSRPRSASRLSVGSAAALVLVCILTSSPSLEVCAFSTKAGAPSAATSSSSNSLQPYGNILILDHLNINHEKGRHDLLTSFYFDFLKCAVDPRKEENLVKGTKTLWANIGANQFHLPEGRPSAQVFDGIITLSYQNIDGIKGRYTDGTIQDALGGTKFNLIESGDDDELLVTDPWGTKFRIVKSDDPHVELDPRGTQKGGPSEGLALKDLTVYAPAGSNFPGIARFYDQVLGAPAVLNCEEADDSPSSCTVSVGPRQTLTFVSHPDGPDAKVSHDDLVDGERVEGKPHYLSNFGPHVSVYVADLRSTYNRAVELGLAYVNPRFKRRAYTLEEVMDDCMFRCLDIVDPDDVDAGPILKLEHEVRSVVKSDGSKYKSCPFDEIPEGCVV